MADLHRDLRPGDAFLHNSPYHGNTHAADHTILVPVFDEHGAHRFTVLAKGHQADCGNAQPTTYAAEARDVYEEGALIFPCVRVQRDYGDLEDVIRMCEMRLRVPAQWRGDYLALLGSARVGERRLAELGAEVGWDTLADYSRAWFDYSEQRMAARDPRAPERPRAAARARTTPSRAFPTGSRSRSTVDVDSEAGRIEVDLRDNPDSVPCGLNLTEATATRGRHDGRLQQPARRRADELGRVPPRKGPSPRRLRRRDPAPPDLLLGGDHERRRPGRQRRPPGVRRHWGRVSGWPRAA